MIDLVDRKRTAPQRLAVSERIETGSQVRIAERVRELAQREFFVQAPDAAGPRCILSPSVLAFEPDPACCGTAFLDRTPPHRFYDSARPFRPLPGLPEGYGDAKCSDQKDAK